MFYENSMYMDDIAFCAQNISDDRDISVLVTGATGLIGTFVVDTLQYQNIQGKNSIKITVTSRDIEKLRTHFSYYSDCNNIQLVQRDVTEEIPQEENYDYIIHLASNADPRSYALYPVETITTNVLGTLNLMEYLESHPQCKAVLASTFEVYGELEEHDSIKESDYGLIDYNIVRSGYPESKRVAELLVKSFVEAHSVNAVIARLSSIYGPTMAPSDNKAAAQFIRKAIAKENIVLKSKGTQKRSYTYVADCAAGIFIVLFRGKAGEAYNVCNPNSVLTIAELAHLAAEVVGTSIEFDCPDEIEAKGFGKAKNSVLDADKIQNLGFTPLYTAKNGLTRTIEIMQHSSPNKPMVKGVGTK